MLKAVRRQFNPATLLALVALVFAMTGGAYAVTGGGKSGSHATAQAAKKKGKSKKSKGGERGPAGPRGPEGKQGPAGPAGPQGPAGAEGKAGANGKDGANGINGGAGESVTMSHLGPGQEQCEEGGVKLTVSGNAETICDGERGAKGAEGPQGPQGPKGEEGKPGVIQPGNPVGTAQPLPPEATETGVWSFGPLPEGLGGAQYEAVASFPIPLSKRLEPTQVHIIDYAGEEIVGGAAQPQTACKGNLEAPTAAPGNLCVYETIEPISGAVPEFLMTPERTPGAGVTGALMMLQPEATGWPQGAGTWAVTAEP
jgi:Collagen triple helix repeat (20 copies)